MGSLSSRDWGQVGREWDWDKKLEVRKQQAWDMDRLEEMGQKRSSEGA